MTDVDRLVRRQPLPPPTARPVPSHATIDPPRRRRRRHAASGSRIASAGLGTATMFGLVASMGVASAVADGAVTTPPATTPAVTTPQPPSATTATVTLTPTSEVPTPPSASGLAPVTLTARPEVRVVTPSPADTGQAPAATTRGSR